MGIDYSFGSHEWHEFTRIKCRYYEGDRFYLRELNQLRMCYVCFIIRVNSCHLWQLSLFIILLALQANNALKIYQIICFIIRVNSCN